MNTTIDRVLFHLERAGIFEDEDHIFKAGTTNEEPSHARRVLRSILLAAQMITMQGRWDQRADYIVGKPPDLVHSLADHLKSLVKFFVCSGYLYIRDLDANMSGTPDAHQYPILNGLYSSLVTQVLEEVMASGPSFLLQLLERKKSFRTVTDLMGWIYRLYKGKEPPRQDKYYHILLHVYRVDYWTHGEHLRRWRGRDDDLGIKNSGDLDLTKWAKAIPDEETWAALMLQLGWIGPEQSVRKLLRLPSQA